MRIKLIITGLLLTSATGAQAASAGIFTRQGSQGMNNPGFATVSFSTAGQFVTANASEYRGGVGVFASAASNSAADGGDHIPQASASARFVDQMRVGRNDDLFELGNGVFALTVKFSVTGGASISQTPAPNGVGMAAQAAYNWSYNIGQFGGGGGVNRSIFHVGNNIPVMTDETKGLGATGTFGEVLIVRLDEVYSLALAAEAFAAGASYGGGAASGVADFGHTLRWLGVSRIQYQDENGSWLDAPDGYKLTLTSADGQFDYWNAAGPNPFVSSVPEPASWAMMIAGFGMAGVASRRRALVRGAVA